MSETILISGGTGLIGTRLTELLLEAGYQVAYLSRSASSAPNVSTYQWDVKSKKIDTAAIEAADYVVHLAGASVAGQRWTEAYKREIMESRTLSTELLYEQLKIAKKKPKAFIAASAIGYYGNTGETPVDEQAPPGTDFLADVCREWENRSHKVAELGIRTVIIRVGVVLSEKGGALPQMAMPVRFFAGAPIGPGDQHVSWIHLDDISRIFKEAITNPQLSGVVNGVAPSPVTNQALTKAIGSVLSRPVWPINVPTFALKAVLGEMTETVLASNKVQAKKLEAIGFQFNFPFVIDAVRNLLKDG